MNWLTKALSKVVFPGRSFVWFDFPRPDGTDLAAKVGDGTSSDVVMTPIRWLQRSFIEAPITVVDEDGEIIESRALELLRQPNPFYPAELLYMATVFSLSINGNAYWLCQRQNNQPSGEVVAYWYIPHSLIEPKWPDDGSEFISHYLYRPAGRSIRLEISDVIHFRDGIDPQNVRLGLSPLRSLMLEIWTDDEAAAFTAMLLKNQGVPGLILSPSQADATIDIETAKAMEEKLGEKFTGGGRGRPLVMLGPTNVEQFGFSPEQMDLSKLRNVSEERVTAALGVPAAVVGFGAGLQQTKVGATMRELRMMAWHSGVMPLQRLIAAELNRSLLPALGEEKGTVKFDNSEVAALQEDATARNERIRGLVKDSIWTRAEGRAATGQDVSPADDVFLMPISTIAVPRQAPPIVLLPPEQRSIKDHTLTEERIAERQSRSPPQAVQRYAAQLDLAAQLFEHRFAAQMLDVFKQLGSHVFAVAVNVLAELEERGSTVVLFKQATDALMAARINEGIDLLGAEAATRTLFETSYLSVGREVAKAVDGLIGISVGLPDIVERSLLATGGTRAGLLDLTDKTKRFIFDGLLEGREEGLAGRSLARKIADRVERGTWSTPEIRSRVIARTELAFATNVSSIELAAQIDGVERMMLLDARAGSTDAICEQLNGTIVTLAEARQLAIDEHPNGTRNFTPLPATLLAELEGNS